MSIDRQYIPAFSIETVMLDKDTGLPLSNGVVTFYKDNQRATMKNVWQISGSSPNYTFTQLPNPMTLSDIGTFVDSLGNPVVPYFYPFDANDVPEYYYVTVESAGAVSQFTRESVPYIPDLPATTDESSGFDNMLSNPQFVEVNFDTSVEPYVYTYSGASLEVTSIAPDWDLIVTGTGTVELTRLTPSGALGRPTNAPYFLKILSTGSISLLQLRQRLYQDPNIWASNSSESSYLSCQFTGKTASEVVLSMLYVDSNGTSQTLFAQSFPTAGAYGTVSANKRIDVSTSPDEAPAGYVDIIIDLEPSVETEITSIQVVPTYQTPVTVPYNQTPRNRQVDQLYHDAYPIVPVGGIIDYAGFSAPDHYLSCNGAAYSRIDYQRLFRALTTTESVSLTTGVNTFTVASSANYHIGMSIEGTGIAAATTITGIAGTTITMSNNATATATSTVTFFAWGAGDGSTTFNVPDLREYVTAGANGSLFGAGLNAVGYRGGASTHTLASSELPPHTHTYTHYTTNNTGSAGGSDFFITNGTDNTGDGGFANNAFSIVQKTALVFKYIRYE